MAKRRVYIPTRDEGWSNGKYWKERTRDKSVEDMYTAYCPECDIDTVHEYDMCLPCDEKQEKTKNT